MSALHYALYATPDGSIIEGVFRIKRYVEAFFPGLIEIAREPAHFTVVYGPALAADATEARTVSEAAEIYPEAVDWGVNIVPTTFRGVSHFVRPPRTLVHLEFENTQLTALQKVVRTRLADVNAEYAARHAITGKYDRSNDADPKRWLHIAIGTVPESTSAADLIRIEDAVRDQADAFIPPRINIRSLDLISAVTDTPIVLQDCWRGMSLVDILSPP